MISEQIPHDSGSLLDIGSNLGVFTAAAAKAGMWSIGLEQSEDLIKRARANYAQLDDHAFIRSKVDLDTCRKLPRFDVVLILSVHHHWHANYGEDVAANMLKVIVQKTSRLVVFEGPSRQTRYGESPPDFIDNDENSVTSYYRDFLSRAVGDDVREIKSLGKAHCVGDREPFRWMYGLHK